MLRPRQSMKSKQTLSHRKSTSSARSVVLEHLDPAVAQRDAHIAAHQAFARAQDRSAAATEMALFPPPSSPSPLRRPYSQDASTQKENTEAHAAMSDGPSLHRRQSVRFVGPCTIHSRGPASKVQRPQTPGRSFVSALDPAAILLGSDDEQSVTARPVPTLHHPQPRPGTSASTCSSKIVGDYLQTLVAADELYTPEDDIASAPSSYRRLRRSQSLHPSRVAGHARGSADSYLAPGPGARREVRTSMSMRTLGSSHAKENVRPQKVPTLKAPKSMSFLKGRRGRISSITSHNSGTTTQVITDRGQIPLRTKTSGFFGSKSRRPESGLRKTLRSSDSHADLAPPPTDLVQSLPKDTRGSLRSKARKASKTLKSKFLNLFSSSKEDEEGAFPDQHVKSHRSHTDKGSASFDTDPDEQSQQENGNGTHLHYDHPNMSEVFSTSHGPSVFSRKASLRGPGGRPCDQEPNEEGALDDKSRVTSWTNSGPSTLTSEQQMAWREWEKQRLSIIKENGAHCPSPSLRRQAIGKHILQSQESLTGQPIPPGPTIDSQRVYAALMERLAETTQLAQIVEQQRKSLPESTQTTALGTDFEDYEDNGAKPAPLAVRRVVSKESLTVIDADSNYHENASAGQIGPGKRISPPITLNPWNGNHGTADGNGALSSDRTNGFFGSPETHLFRTISPYRRALRKSMEEAEHEMHGRDSSGDRVVSDCGTEIRRPEEAAFDEVAYSESVYSSDEQPAARAPDNMQSLTEVVHGPPSSAGNVSISVDPPVTYRPTGHRVVSSVSSIDWKTWLSANVARLEPSPSPPRRSEVDFVLPTMPKSFGQGHVREAAQIDGDEDLGQQPGSAVEIHKPAPPTSPLAMSESNSGRVTPLQRQVPRTALGSASVSVNSANKMSLSELRQSLDTEPLPSPELPPPIPPRSPLRQNPYPASAIVNSVKKRQQGEAPHANITAEDHSPTNLRVLARRRELNNSGSPSTPTPKPTRPQKKRSGFLYTPSVVASNAATSPGLTAAVEKQFGPTSKAAGTNGENKENEASGGESYGLRKSGRFGSLGSGSEERSTKGKRMVDVFLSSRRKRMASSDDSTAFL